MHPARILIFAKYPEPGKVKTRMVPPLTHAEAAELHTATMLATCELASRVRAARVEVVVSPDERAKSLASILPDTVERVSAQGAGDLGRRLTRVTKRVFAEQGGPIVLLGADSPTLSPERIEAAMERLSDHDAILGPCADGGYYLLALSRFLPELFEDISWGADTVASQTRQRAAGAGIALGSLDPWYDLDRFEDMPRALRDLSAQRPGEASHAGALLRLLRKLVEA